LNYTLTKAKLDQIEKLPKKIREESLRKLGESEWKRCSEDFLYWIDFPKYHPDIPYVYTQDPKDMFLCKICKDGLTHHFHALDSHLRISHEIELTGMKEIRGQFDLLPRTRPFVLFDYMRPIIDTWFRYNFIAIEKSRDMMATWLTVALYTWDTLYNAGKENIFQGQIGSKTLDLVKRADFIYRNQPTWLKSVHPAVFSVGQNRAGSLDVPTLESHIFGLPQGADQIRMYHPSGFYCDEAAFIPDAANVFSALKPAIQGGGRYTAVSSASPGFFHMLTTDQLEGF
jgi:hypothetical protein